MLNTALKLFMSNTGKSVNVTKMEYQNGKLVRTHPTKTVTISYVETAYKEVTFSDGTHAALDMGKVTVKGSTVQVITQSRFNPESSHVNLYEIV